MEGIFQEVKESMANEKAALNAFNQLKDMQITKDSVKNLPPKALSVYLVAKFDVHVVSCRPSPVASPVEIPAKMPVTSVGPRPLPRMHKGDEVDQNSEDSPRNRM